MKVRCPHCNSEFQMDDGSYAQIVEQVRNEEFNKNVQREILAREKSWKDQADSNVVLATNDLNRQLASAKLEIQKLEQQINAEKQQAEIDRRDMASAMKAESEKKIQELKVELDYYKDMKTKLSTKMVGESLEQYCYNEFNRVRQVAFPEAYFEKDNDVSSGSKGDFIFREARGGVEFLSIMFDMKNEMPGTKEKHKNEDFFKKLDKDRRDKKCEYAVLVSLLEADNDYYNDGIVDVSYKYPKMYVIRPQFFITFIGLLRGIALESIDAKQELAQYKAFNLDTVRFEQNFEDFKTKVENTVTRAGKQYDTAIAEIDKSISHLEKVRDELMKCQRTTYQLAHQTDDMTIKKLTTGSPSIRKMFNESGVKPVKDDDELDIVDVEEVETKK